MVLFGLEERWLSSRKPRFAKPLYGLNRTGGSNPPLSAILQKSRFESLLPIASSVFGQNTNQVPKLFQAVLARNRKSEITPGSTTRITNETGVDLPREQ